MKLPHCATFSAKFSFPFCTRAIKKHLCMVFVSLLSYENLSFQTKFCFHYKDLEENKFKKEVRDQKYIDR